MKTCTELQLPAMLDGFPALSMGGSRMRGRKPTALALLSADRAELERIARCDCSPWYQVRRARIVLEIASGRRRTEVASQLACDESTVWQTCARYWQSGLPGLLADQRQGHSRRDAQITPLQRAQIVELACLEPIASRPDRDCPTAPRTGSAVGESAMNLRCWLKLDW
jgi:hypothetical protein